MQAWAEMVVAVSAPCPSGGAARAPRREVPFTVRHGCCLVHCATAERAAAVVVAVQRLQRAPLPAAREEPWPSGPGGGPCRRPRRPSTQQGMCEGKKGSGEQRPDAPAAPPHCVNRQAWGALVATASSARPGVPWRGRHGHRGAEPDEMEKLPSVPPLPTWGNAAESGMDAEDKSADSEADRPTELEDAFAAGPPGRMTNTGEHEGLREHEPERFLGDGHHAVLPDRGDEGEPDLRSLSDREDKGQPGLRPLPPHVSIEGSDLSRDARDGSLDDVESEIAAGPPGRTRNTGEQEHREDCEADDVLDKRLDAQVPCHERAICQSGDIMKEFFGPGEEGPEEPGSGDQDELPPRDGPRFPADEPDSEACLSCSEAAVSSCLGAEELFHSRGLQAFAPEPWTDSDHFEEYFLSERDFAEQEHASDDGNASRGEGSSQGEPELDQHFIALGHMMGVSPTEAAKRFEMAHSITASSLPQRLKIRQAMKLGFSRDRVLCLIELQKRAGKE